jgi:hypothetical protein
MATANDFPIEQNVQHKGNKARKGVVIGNKLSDGDQVVAVEWADGTLAKANVNDIEKCLSIEEEFAAMQQQVNDKIAQAATLIREAAALAAANGKDLRSTDDENYDYLFDQDSLESAMEDAGWNTSSWHC